MSDNPQQHILLIDDDETFSGVLARALTRRGFTVCRAANPEQALAQAAKHQPKKAVVDLNLGNTTGLKLIPPLLQLCPGIRILILTGYSSVATAVEAMKLGAVNYLCKPASTDELIAAFEGQTANPDIVIPDNPPSIERVEWEHIQRVLQENENNISATARALGMHRRTLQRKLRKRPVRQ